MRVILGDEANICNCILNGQTSMFVIRSSKIGRLGIGGSTDCPRFIVSDNRNQEKHNDELLVVEVIQDGDYYFKPIFSDDKILIYSEDYFFVDCLDAPLGEIKTSTNRHNHSLKNPHRSLFNHLDSDYVIKRRDLVIENPLAISLSDLTRIDRLLNKKMIIEYNMNFAEELSQKLLDMKISASNELREDYKNVCSNNGKVLYKKYNK